MVNEDNNKMRQCTYKSGYKKRRIKAISLGVQTHGEIKKNTHFCNEYIKFCNQSQTFQHIMSHRMLYQLTLY